MELPRFEKKDLFLACLLIFAFLASRLVNLTLVPIFTDEAIYLRWAQIAKNDPEWRFISLTDGKQPLYVWLTMVFMKLITDPLVAGRLVSIFAGLTSMIGIWLLSYVVFENKKTAFFSSFLYLAFPFSMVYDRMALMDSLVGTFSILSLFLSVLLVKTLRLDVALILGAVLGGGILTKTSGFFSIYLLPLMLLIFDWQKKKRWLRLGKWLGLTLLAVMISQGFYGILRLSPLFHMISQKDTTFVYSINEWIKHPSTFLWGNLKGEFDWLHKYLTQGWLFLAAASFLFREGWRKKFLLFLWFLSPFIALALFGKVLYPRFIFFMVLPLLVLAASSLTKLTEIVKNKIILITLFILFVFYPIYVDYQILFKPAEAYIPMSDKGQYIISWPAGIGIKEVVNFLKEEAKNQKIVVATEGTFGMFPASLELYLWDNKNVEIKGYWPVREIPPELIEKAQSMAVYFVFNETRKFPQNWPLELVAVYEKERPYAMHLFKVLPGSKETK